MDEVKWLSNDEQVAWRAWLAVNAQLTARMNRDLQAKNRLSLADYDVLVNLTDVPDRSLRMYELGDKLQWEKSRLSRQVMRMAARGLVERRECLDDRRGAFVDLTPAGLDAIRAAAPEHVKLIRQVMFDAFTADEVATLTTLYHGVLERLEAKPAGTSESATTDGSAA